MTNLLMDQCRHSFEAYVNGTIKPEARDQFLKTGSSHWLDYKAGWMAGRQFTQSESHINATKR